MVEALCCLGANIDAEDFHGRTPLIIATTTTRGNLDAVALLLALNCDVTKADNYGLRADQCNKPLILDLLAKHSQKSVILWNKFEYFLINDFLLAKVEERTARKDDVSTATTSRSTIDAIRSSNDHRSVLGVCIAQRVDICSTLDHRLATSLRADSIHCQASFDRFGSQVNSR